MPGVGCRKVSHPSHLRWASKSSLDVGLLNGPSLGSADTAAMQRITKRSPKAALHGFTSHSSVCWFSALEELHEVSIPRQSRGLY